MGYPPPNRHPLAPTAEGAAADMAPAGRAGTTPPLRGKLVRKKGPTGAMEPATAMHRANIQENMGSRLRIDVNLPGPQSPEAAHTQANGRIIRGGGSSSVNFGEEMRQP